MKQVLHLCSKIRGLFSASQCSDVGYDCRLTVGSPSVRHCSTMLKLVSVLAILLTVGVGSAWGTTYTYTPSGTYSASGGTSTISGVQWTYSSATYCSLNSSKIQIGSKNDPQTSNWTIQTAISNFGSGKKVTAISLTAYTTATTATYDISAGGASVESGSLTTSSKTYTASSLNVTSGNIVITMKGSNSSKAMYLCGISVTYEDAGGGSKYTVSFNTGTGNPSQADITEASGGAGITLPAGPTPTCSGDGWSFAGWKETSAVTSETTVAPTLLSAGSTFHPTGNVTLYAVYKKGTLSNNYEKITTSAALTSGSNYVIARGTTLALDASDYYMDDGDGYFGTTSISVSDNTISNPSADLIWEISGNNTDGYSFYNANQNLYIGYSTTEHDLYADGTKHSDYTITYTSSNFYVKSKAESSYYFATWSYSIGSGSAYFFEINNSSAYIVLYKQKGELTYFSNPTCCTQLGTINGSISLTNEGCTPNQLKATWKMSATTGIASQVLHVYKASDDTEITASKITGISASTSNQTQTISGLDPCTAYYVKVENISSGGAFCGDGFAGDKSSNATTNAWGVTEHLTHTTHTTGAATACPGSNYVATYTVESGYVLPSDITLTIGGASKTKDTHYTWSVSGDVGTLTILAANITNSAGAIDITITSTAAAYQFWYGPSNSGDGWTATSFTDIGNNEWQITNFVIPAYEWDGAKQLMWNVSGSGISATNREFYALAFAQTQHNGCGDYNYYNDDTNKDAWIRGAGPGAKGTLRIYDNKADNGWCAFIPNEYVLKFGTSEVLFTETSTNVWETAITDLSTLNSGTWTGSTTYRVGVGDASHAFVAVSNKCAATAVSAMGYKTNAGDNWATGLNNISTARGKFRIWINNCTNGNWECHFVPYHRVVFHSNYPGGGGPADTYAGETSVEESNGSIALADAPSAPTGYHFIGWYDAAEGGNLITTARSISAGASANIDLYAHWSNQTTITLSKNGGSENGSAVGTYGSNVVGSFVPVTRNSTTYRLLGYSKSGTPAEIVIDASGNFVANTTYTDASGNWTSTLAEVTLVAQWQAGHTITWMANGETHSTSFVDTGETLVLPGSTPTSCDASDTETYTTFIGWYSTAAGTSGSPTASISSCGTKATTSIVPDANQTYYAVWGNGGLSADDVKQVTLDFTSNTNWQFPENSGAIISSTDENSYTSGGYTIKVAGDGSNGYYYNTTNNYFFIGKNGAYIKLPAFSFVVSKINVTTTTGMSPSTSYNIYSGTNAASSSYTGRAGSGHDFVISDDYDDLGTIYQLQVTNAYNLQVTKMEIYSPGVVATGFISSCCASPAIVSVTPTSSSLELDIDGQATTSVSVSQSGGGAGRYYPPTVTPSATGSTDWAGEYKTSAYSVNFTATAAGTYTVKAPFRETSYGCDKTGSATITVAANPLIQTSVNALTVNGVCDDSGSPQTFTLNSRYLPEGSKTLTITAATTSLTGGAYKVSLDGSTYSTSVNVTGGVGSKATQTVYVRYDGVEDETGSLTGSVTISNGVTEASVTLSGTCSCGTYVKLTPANETSTHILAPNGQWTRAQGAIAIRANYLSSAAANVIIVLTSSNSNFKFTETTTSGTVDYKSEKIVTASNNSWDGTIYVVYTPTTYNASETTTIKAQVHTYGGVYDDAHAHATTTTTVYGRSFPETFVLAVNTGSSWVAVPADMVAPYGGSGNECTTGVGTHDPYPITVNDNANPTSASNVPARAIYKGASRNTPTSAPWTVQMESNSQTGYYLWGSKTANTIANQNYATGERQKWFAESSDLVTFNFHLDDSIRTAGARLGYSGSAIGQYVSAASSYKYDFRILPISDDPCTYVINPVMTLSAYDGTNATVSIPYDGTTNYEISKNAKSTWTDIVGAIDCKTLNFTLPLATYRGQDVWLRADGTICQGDATSVSALHIPAPVITDPGAQHLYGVINVATSESFAVTGTDMYGTITVTSSNPAITANYSEGNITVNMASTAVADDYETTLTLSSVGAANVTVNVTITIRDLAEMTFSIEDLSNGKICHNSLRYTDKFYVYLNGGNAVYSAADGSTKVNATSQFASSVFIRDLSTGGADGSSGFNYAVSTGVANFYIPTTNLVYGHTYRISYYNNSANSGAGLFSSEGLGFADAHVDFVYSADCDAPTALVPCNVSPISVVTKWDFDDCAGNATVDVYTKSNTELVNQTFTTNTHMYLWSQRQATRWNTAGTGKNSNSSYGYPMNYSTSSSTYASWIYSPTFVNWKSDLTTNDEVVLEMKFYNSHASTSYTVDWCVTTTPKAGSSGAPTPKRIYVDGVYQSADMQSFSVPSGNKYTTFTFTLKGLATTDVLFIKPRATVAGNCHLNYVKMFTTAKNSVTSQTPACSNKEATITGLTANTTYYYTVTNSGHTSNEVPFTTWTSGSSYVKFYEDAGHATEIEALDKIEVLGGQTTHVYMVGQKVPGCEVVPTVSSGYGLEDHTTYDPATGALGGYIDLTLTNPATTSGTLTITDGAGTTYTRPIKSSSCPTDFETLALPATSITNNGATANWNSSADFEGVTEGTLYLYRDGVVDAEYITNESFETGDLTGWNFLNVGAIYACDAYSVVSSNTHSGTHALYATAEGTIYSGFGYTTVIYGNPVTLPAGKYVMTSWVKVPVYSGYSDKHSYFKQGLVGCTLIGSTNETHYALSENYFDVLSNNTYVQLRDTFELENAVRTLPIVGHRADVGYTFHPFYLDDVSLKRISAPNAEEPDKVFPIADMSAASSQALGTLSGNTQYTYLLKNENGCPSNSITFKTLPADGPTISAEDIEISAPAGSSATGVIVVQVWDATAEISVSKGVASGSDQITLSSTTVPQEGGTIRVLFTPNTAPGSTGTCPVILNTRGLDDPVTVNISWTVTAGEDTDKPIIEVTEISNEWMNIEHNVDADSVRIVMNREKTADEIVANVGDEIFFSKYYEAYSHKKLWAIYNPTNDTISLAGMEVWRSSSSYDGWHSGVMDLSEMGYIKPGWICPNEEIVVYTTNQIGTCEQNTVGLDVMSTWWQEGTSSDMPLSFSGDDALLLVRNTSAVTVARHNALPTTSAKDGSAISWPDPYSNARGEWYMLDIIGGRTDGGSPSGKNVQSAWHWYNSKTGAYEDGDDRGWVGYGQDMSGAADYNTASEHPGYLLSTNRCLLVRKKSVTSGANAINSNIENMATLSTEWQGAHVPTEGDQNAVSCSNFSFVGSYDYAGYYNAWTEIGAYEVGAERNPDGSFTVEMDVPEYYCKTIHIEVMSIDTINGVLSENVHAYENYKVPIVVDANKLTTADLFEFGGDTCANCDVVIRDEAKLSHVSGGVSQFRNMTVYPGAKFDNSAKQGFLLDGLLMQGLNDTVGYAIINNNGSTIEAGKIVHVKRIDDEYWYPFSLPYDCDVAAIRQLNGKSMGEYWEDWGIKYYDGEARQLAGESAAPGSNSKFWKQMPVGGTLKANEGYIIGLFTTEWPGQRKSVYFPPKTSKEYTEAGDGAKTTDVHNWAAGIANEKRHHGWNFVGSPYISLFGSSTDGHGMNNTTNLILGKIENDGSYSDLGNVYISRPDGAASKTYTQVKASATTIEPFRGYFVQTVDPDNGEDNTLNLTYQKTDRTLGAAPARKATAEKQRVEVDLVVDGNGSSDIAGAIVDDPYTIDYEIGGDLTKMYATTAKPQLYFLGKNNEKLAYIAIPDANAENIVMELYAPKAGEYVISLNAASSRVAGAESVELLYQGNVVANLLIENYTIGAQKGTVSGYSVRIRRAAQVVTSTEEINGERIIVISNNGQMSITNLPGDAKVYVYDVAGRLMSQGSADGEHIVNIDAPQQGVYQVVIHSSSGIATIKTLVR